MSEKMEKETVNSVFPHLRQSYIVEKTVRAMEVVQGRQFLKTGVTPVVGQRVEIKCLLAVPTAAGNETFRMSGQVTSIESSLPAAVKPQGGPNDTSPGASWWLSHRVLPHPGFVDHFLPHLGVDKKNGVYEACTCGEPECAGVFFLSQKVWENDISEELKERCLQKVKEDLGSLPGQQVKAECRLNFDHDICREKMEGPWQDGLNSVDGRDIWELDLFLDDSKENSWVGGGSECFRNLGRNRQARGFPWSNINTRPYEYGKFVQKAGQWPLLLHLCIGPFGCDGKDHDHSFGAAA